jgi:hypothetical protein
VEILDHVFIAVPIAHAPGIQKVIGRFPHGLQEKRIKDSQEANREKLNNTVYIDNIKY